MMLSRNLRKKIIAAIICVTVLFVTSPSAFATEPHEDPEAAKPVFSGISLLRYYSGSLDFVLQKNPTEVEARLEKMPFANIPQGLEESADDFTTSSINMSHMVVAIDEDLGKLRMLRKQFRLDEATELAVQTSDNLSQADSELELIERATATIGEELKVSSTRAQSDLKRSYDEVMERIDRIREMLALYQELLESMGITVEELLKPTDIILEVQPTVAFMGDNIRFEGVLTSGGRPLAGREVDILLTGSRYVTVKTDARGHYRGELQVPYWYIPQLDLQALYYPQDKDIGVYLASLSPVTKVKILFYEAELEVTVEDKTYPGLETTVTGRFDYGQSPPLNERKVEIYFDDVLINEVIAPEAFTQEIKIGPEADVGEHTITVSSAAVGKYSPVDASVILNVTRATPILDISIPRLTVIPGSVGLEGKLYSEVGPLSGAAIKMGLGKSQVELVSSEDGAFDTEIKVGMGFGVIGRQKLVTQVLPQEPWHASLNTTSSVLMVNVVNSGAFVAVLLFLGIYLPGRLRRRLGTYPKRTVIPVMVTAPPEPAPTYSQSVTTLTSNQVVAVLTATEGSEETSREPRVRIFHGYSLVVGLIQGITSALLKPKPEQTLREFANEARTIFGPATRYFIELTRIVERLLYSQYRPTEKDVDNSQQLSRRMWEESKPEVTMHPLLARQLGGEGTGTQFERNELSVVGGARAFEFDGRALTTSSWGQLATWLWVLLMLTVAYYACTLLFLLPLLLASLALCLPLVIVDDSSERGSKAMSKEESKDEDV